MSKIGSLYLAQTEELVGTNRYKIGCSHKQFQRILKGYRMSDRIICYHECSAPFQVEIRIKNEFKTRFKLVAGREIFEGNEEEIKQAFNDIVTRYTIINKDVDDYVDNIFDNDSSEFRYLCPNKFVYIDRYIEVKRILAEKILSYEDNTLYLKNKLYLNKTLVLPNTIYYILKRKIDHAFTSLKKELYG